jgi:hypothetical protein
MTRIVWAHSVQDLFLELPQREREAILEHLKYLKRFPHMYPFAREAASVVTVGFKRETGRFTTGW